MHWYFLVNDKSYEFSCLEDLFQLNTFTLSQSSCDVSGSLQRCFIGFNSGFWLVQSTFTEHSQLSPRPSCVLLAVCSKSLSCWMTNLQPDLQDKGLKAHSIQLHLRGKHMWCFTVKIFRLEHKAIKYKIEIQPPLSLWLCIHHWEGTTGGRNVVPRGIIVIQ